MCGIAGLVRWDGRAVDPAALRELTSALAHRGPDDVGYLGVSAAGAIRRGRDAGVAAGSAIGLCHRRLSILDLGEGGWQPMTDDSGRRAIVFNGEIYNHQELRRELAAEGCRFHTRSDTEVLLAALGRWGPAAVSRLVGMWALALLDLEARRLLLARDPFGIKPLHWTVSGGALFFASELRALAEASGVPRRVSPGPLYDYLRFGLTDHGEETLFAGLRQLLPGEVLSFPLDAEAPPTRVHVERIAPDPALQEEARRLGEAGTAERLRMLFLDSVRLHLRSDVPVGAALSGGLDSSAIVSCMRRVEPGLDLHVFGYVADDPVLCEERWIELAAASAHAKLHTVRARAEELARDLDEVVRAQETPFGSTSIYAQWRVFRLARDHGIQVALDGQGADELFAGYRTYLASRFASLVRQGRLGDAASYLARCWRGLAPSERKGLLLRAGGLVAPRAFEPILRRIVGEELEPSWLDAGWFRARRVAPRPLFEGRAREVLREHLHDAVTRSSLPMLLRFEDRNSMAHSVESRVPFLHPALARLALSLPEEWLVAPDGTSKAIFRRAMEGIVPAPILARRDKIGFATPEQRWLAALAPWVEAVLASEAARRVPCLRRAPVLALWRRSRDAGRPLDPRVWRLVNLARWSELLGVSFDDA